MRSLTPAPPAALVDVEAAEGRIIGSHPLMLRLYQRVEQAAASKATVLIEGESGTGKELVARALHDQSIRCASPYIYLNCAALSESVLESELFGHEKGAFTGALARRVGRFERAHQGTLFLDEVSEVPLQLQVKLLRFLQERKFERVGGDDTLTVDVRVVAATNKPLRALVDEGYFREDLFYRLNVVTLAVPALRMRPSDIPQLADHFLERYKRENERNIDGYSSGAYEAMLRYPWPGNVRELQHAVEQAVVFCRTSCVEKGDLPMGATHQRINPVDLMVPGVTLAELERYAVLKTLDSVNGCVSKAAAILDVSRRTIHYKLREWGIKH